MIHKKHLWRRRRRRSETSMDNHTMTTRPRNRFWFVFFVLFFFWYLLLYGSDWSSLPGLSSVSRRLDRNDSISDDNLSDNVNNISDDQVVAASDHEAIRDNLSENYNISDANYNSNNESSSLGNDEPVASDHDVIRGNSSRNINIEEFANHNSSNESSRGKDEIEDFANMEKEIEQLLPKDEKNDDGVKGKAHKPCAGRYIYVQNLPARFNDEYVKNCKLLNPWHDMCQYFANGGLGENLGNPQRLFQRSGWFVTNQFSLDVIFRNRMKQYECLTNDSSEAAAIYVPYYSGLDVSRFLWGTYNTSVKDADFVELFKLLKSKPEWDKMGGRDHFMVSGRITWDLRRSVDKDTEWGNKLMIMPESQNMTMLTIESSPWDKNDFAIPYPTYFHPSSDGQVYEWQSKVRKMKRRALYCFAGAPRPNMEGSIRGEIMEQCAASGRKKCKMMECKDDKRNCLKPANVMRMFQSSVFCLQPPGDSFTRRSTFDSIVAGCIPVFFSPGSAYVQYLWHLPKDFGSYSVLIPEGEVKSKKTSIESVLSRIPASKVARMRENVIKLIPSVIYADPRSRLEKLDDAFDLAVRGVVERVESLRREMKEGRNSSGEFGSEFSWKYFTFGTTDPHEWDSYFKRHR